ncbi:MAG: DUF4845 domain-containing protein [Granulosicoccus sp.]
MSSNKYPQYWRQAGLGFTGYLVVLSVAIFIGLFAIKLGPHYSENWTVTNVALDLAKKPEILKLPRSEVYNHINNAYRTNNLWDLKGEDTIKLTRDAKLGYIVSVEYERRSRLFHNIDLVTTFNKTTNAPM